MSRRDLLLGTAMVAAGVVLFGLALLAAAYGLNLFSYPAGWWRDHPFDFGNILHTTETFSFSARLWAQDPMHLFGWTPGVFYNPLATAAASVFVSLFGSGEGAYRGWLLVLLFGTSLAFLPLLPRDSGKGPWVIGGISAALLSLLVYPQDVGILDANPVQVLYTGQWAQRLGLALGLLAVICIVRALEALEGGLRPAIKKTLTAAALLGAATFCHYMSGYAAAACGALLCVLYLLAHKIISKKWSWLSLLVLPAVLLAAVLLFLDFFYVFFSLAGSHHHLPLLGWRVAGGALVTVREVMIPALPIMLIPLSRMLVSSERSRPELSRALFPLLVLAAAVAATPGSLLLWFVVVFLAALGASRMEKEFSARHWLPVAGFFLWLLACGPDSLQIFGLDLSVLIPFSGSVGWAKLAAFSRWLFLAWFAVLAVEGLGSNKKAGRILALGLLLCGLLIPLLLSTGGGKAHSFFDWMNQTDRKATGELLQRMQGVAARTPRDGYLLVEDTLHHPEGTVLPEAVPNGHLPYLTGLKAGRPVLGGAVTTRWLTHPLAHTSRGQLLCRDLNGLKSNPAPVMDRLRSLGVSDVLAHSRELIAALRNYPAALEVDSRAGLTHFALEHYRPILTDGEGLHVEGGKLSWHPDGLEIELPAGTTSALLRQVHHPFLDCAGKCRLSTWSEGSQTFTGCLVDDPREIEVEIPWVRIDVEPHPEKPVSLRIASRPSILPVVVMLLAWLAMIAARLLPGRKRP